MSYIATCRHCGAYATIQHHNMSFTCEVCKKLNPGVMPVTAEKSTVEKTLSERGSRYGDFTDHARLCQEIKHTMQNFAPANWTTSAPWLHLSDVQKQALEVIADKIARILSGDPNYADNWHDIQGYAKLVEDRLPRECGHPKSPLAECGDCTVLETLTPKEEVFHDQYVGLEVEEPTPGMPEPTCCKHGTLLTQSCRYCEASAAYFKTAGE